MEFDVVIVGAGLAGASLAVALRGVPLRIAVVEGALPVTPEGWDARIYAISPVNRDFLDELGVWRRMDRTRINPVREMAVRGDGQGVLRFSAFDSGLSELAWIVESSQMQRELWETLTRQHNVTVLCPAAAERIHRSVDAIQVDLTDGRTMRARLLVGADGARSAVRDLAGITASVTPYGEKGVVANFSCSRPHLNVAHQWFLGEGGVLAWLPLPGNRISMVWSAPDDEADRLLALPPDRLCSEVAAAGGEELGTLTLDTPPAAFPLRLLRVDAVVRERIALIGDAAHAIHPLSGHGINLGFQDARVLAACISGLPTWRDPGAFAVLRRYARARAEEPLLVQYTTHALNRLFRFDHPLISAARNIGMNLTDRTPVLKSALIRYAISGKF